MKKKISIIIIILLLITCTTLPVHAQTLKELEDQVASYQAELNNKNSELAKKQAESKAIASQILNTQNKINTAEDNIKKLEDEIEKSEKEIKKKSQESKNIMSYYQISDGENTYLEYIFGASSITDMIYRMAVVEQLTEYNNNIMNDLKKLIAENKNKKEELKNEQIELTKLKAELEDQKKKIDAEANSIEGTIPNIQGEVKALQSKISYYKGKGCKSNDVIGVTCDVPPKVNTGNGGGSGIINANGFTTPLPGVRISNGYGNNYPPYPHKGYDYSTNCGRPIHAVAAGRVYYVGEKLDNYHAHMVLIVHNVNGRLVFSQYAHVGKYAVSENEVVQAGQVIAYVGSTGWSTGCHLHLEMSTDKGWSYNAGYYEYRPHIINPGTYVPH